VHVPLSPVYIVNPNGTTTNAFANWDSISTKEFVTAVPAAGATPAAITVPAGKRWLPISVTSKVVTAVAAANRYVWCAITMNGTNIQLIIGGLGVIIASKTATTCFGPTFSAQWQETDGLMTTIAAGIGIELPAGATIQINGIAIAGADQFEAARLHYKEAPA